jgi:DNA polymerase V
MHPNEAEYNSTIDPVDLMGEIVKHPAATFMLRVRGESMREAGIFDNDVVLVDKAIRPHSGHIVIAMLNGEFLCKTLTIRHGEIILQAANKTYPDIRLDKEQELEIWSVVIATVKQFPT